MASCWLSLEYYTGHVNDIKINPKRYEIYCITWVKFLPPPELFWQNQSFKLFGLFLKDNIPQIRAILHNYEVLDKAKQTYCPCHYFPSTHLYDVKLDSNLTFKIKEFPKPNHL